MKLVNYPPPPPLFPLLGERTPQQRGPHPRGPRGGGPDEADRDGAEGKRSPRRSDDEARPQRAHKRHRWLRPDGAPAAPLEAGPGAGDDGAPRFFSFFFLVAGGTVGCGCRDGGAVETSQGVGYVDVRFLHTQKLFVSYMLYISFLMS